MGSTETSRTVMIGFIISITENAGLMGVPLPKVIQRAIDVLNDKSEPKTKEDNNYERKTF